MKEKTRYTNEPMEAEVIKDFLPPPEHLVPREDNVKVTVTLSKSSINFFKKHAQQRHTHYQTMIRRLLDLYVAQHQ